MKYLLIDCSNMFFRARHVAYRAEDAWEKVGYALHIMFNAVSKVHKQFDADHVIFALEGRSWRKDFYKPYKANRAAARAALTEKEAEEDKMFWETYESLTKFLSEKTNCSVIRDPNAEADDIIARWIHLHPNDHHVIISSDTDFVQLIADNVEQYNGITDEHITINGTFDGKGKQIIDKKTQEPKHIGDPQWALFLKCMRGDSSDNVFSAYPGVRVKGTKNKVGLTEAYADKEHKGYAWNNLMLQRWTDHEGVEHRVLDDYLRNKYLIDLTAQPDEIKKSVDSVITEQTRTEPIPNVAFAFAKFCSKYDLTRISDNINHYTTWLKKNYQGDLK